MEHDEVWKDVPDYEGYYQVSNKGRVKSLSRTLSIGRFLKEKILKNGFDGRGYSKVILCKNTFIKTYKIHKLVAICFLNHKPNGLKLVVNHKDFNRLNNQIDNLEIVTNRENTNKKHLKSRSKHTGVTWREDRNKWHSQIYINGKQKHLGYFNNEIEAGKAYQEYLKNLN